MNDPAAPFRDGPSPDPAAPFRSPVGQGVFNSPTPTPQAPLTPGTGLISRAISSVDKLAAGAIQQVQGTNIKKYGRTVGPEPYQEGTLNNNATTINRLNALGDAFTWAPFNAAIRGAAEGTLFKTDDWSLIMSDKNTTFGQKLDIIGQKYGVNSPGEINHWARQPGILDNLLRAKPLTPAGMAWQIALGIHADLARLKPAHPWITAAETFAQEWWNPAWGVPGLATGAVRGALRPVMTRMAVARQAERNAIDLSKVTPQDAKPNLAKIEENAANLAEYQRLASNENFKTVTYIRDNTPHANMANYLRDVALDWQNVTDTAPIIGDRFARMHRAGGYSWSNAHNALAVDQGNIPIQTFYQVVDRNHFGGTRSLDHQWEILKQVEKLHKPWTKADLGAPIFEALPSGPRALPGEDQLALPPGNPERGGISMPRFTRRPEVTDEMRVGNLDNLLRGDEAELTTNDPTFSGQFFTANNYVPHGTPDNPAWLSEENKPTFVDYAKRFTSSENQPLPTKPRKYASIEEGEKAGDRRGVWAVPAHWIASHLIPIRRYNNLVDWVKGFGFGPNGEDPRFGAGYDGNPGLLDVEYVYTLPSGRKANIGIGKSGYTAMQQLATRKAEQDAAEWAQRTGLQPDERILNKAKAEVIENFRQNFNEKYPNHNFNTGDALGMPIFQGKALHNDALGAAIDASPQLEKLHNDVRYGAHNAYYGEGVNPAVNAIENLNHLVRQAILTNFVYHPLINLVPKALEHGVPPGYIYDALFGGPTKVRREDFEPWIGRASEDKAVAPKFGASLRMHPATRAKILSLGFKDLLKQDMETMGPMQKVWGTGLGAVDIFNKGVLQLSKVNQDITFGYFEDRLAAAAHRYNVTKLGMTRPQSARIIRGWGTQDALGMGFGDYKNLTHVERNSIISRALYFYSWSKTQARNYALKAVFKPQSILAQTAATTTLNRLRGFPQQANPQTLGLWKNPKTGAWVAMPWNNASKWGVDFYNIFASPFLDTGPQEGAASGSYPLGFNESVRQGVNLLASHATPPLGIGLDVIQQKNLGNQGAIPEPYNDVLFNPQAPAEDQVKQAFTKAITRYLPFPVQNFIESRKAGQENPYWATSLLGPTSYVIPDESISKSGYSAVKQAQQIMTKMTPEQRKSSGYFQLIEDAADGDEGAILQLKMQNKMYKKMQRYGF